MAHFAEWAAGLGPGMANHLWQSTAAVAASWLITLALRQNQARVRYAVWLAASLKFLVPFSLLIAAGNLLPHPKQAVAPVVYSAMDVVEEPFAEMPQFVAPVQHVVTMRERVEAMLPVGLFALWVMGAGVVVLVWASRWRAVRRTLRDAEVAREGREWEILRRVERRLTSGAEALWDLSVDYGATEVAPLQSTIPVSAAKAGEYEDVDVRALKGAATPSTQAEPGRGTRHDGWAIELRLSAERMEPGVVGVWRPVLVWPRELSARLDNEHIEAILAHELAHVRRRDNLTAALHMLVETVFWFHPAVWWMERQMVKEREQACDEAVVAIGGDEEIYAESLLKTCRFCIESPLVCVAGVTGADLKQRVVEIVTARALLRMSWAKKALVSATAVCVIVVPVVLGQAKAAQRLMHAAINAAPKPVQSVAKAMMGDAVSGNADASQKAANAPADNAASAGADMTLGPAFEVATIRPADRNDGRRSFGSTVDASGKFTGSAVTLSSLVRYAYANEPLKTGVVGGPKWADSDFFDVNAKIDAAYMDGWDKLTYSERADRVRPMIRTLLAQRFRLKLHAEMRPTAVYALVQAKGGTKMKEVPAPEPVDNDPGAIVRWMKENPNKPRPGSIFCTGGACTGTAVQISTAIGQIRGSAHADRMVIDQTGLKGYYDFTMPTPPHDDEDAMVEISEALGLKFEPRTMPVKTYLIDSAEKPSVDGAEVQAGTSDDEAQLSGENRKWLDEDAHWLITPQERADFLKLTTDKDRDAFIDSFWERRNAPGAAKGAYKAEIYARIKYANDSFSSPGKPGWATDRGRAVIQYGKPDSVEAHPAGNAPYQVWLYRSLPGIGSSVSLRFIRSGNDYQLSGAWPQANAAGYAPTMTFDVASVRESKRDPNTTWFRVSGGFAPINSGHLTLENNSFGNLIDEAYPVEFDRIEGIPRELSWKTFNIEAKADAATDERLAKLPKEQVKLEQQHMMQVLLAERFRLRVHWETRDAPTYDLVVSKAGRLRTTGDAPSAEMVKAFGDRPIPAVLQQGSSMHGFEYFGYRATADDITEMMNGQFGRPVNNKTRLTGKYYFHLKTWQVRASDRKDDETNPWPPLETAVQDDLGLKLMPSHGPVRYLVVDHIEMPTEN